MEDFVEIRLWGEERMDFLRRFLAFERGLPSHDTLRDQCADAELFKACFTARVEALRDNDPEVIAIDGKTSRRSHARGKGRGATRQRLVLGQEATAGGASRGTLPLFPYRRQRAQGQACP